MTREEEILPDHGAPQGVRDLSLITEDHDVCECGCEFWEHDEFSLTYACQTDGCDCEAFSLADHE